MLSNSQFMENYQEAKGDIVKDEVMTTLCQLCCRNRTELKSTKSELELRKQKKKQKFCWKTKKNSKNLNARLHKKNRKEEYKRAFEQKIGRSRHNNKRLLRANSSANKAIGLKKTINIITGLLIIAIDDLLYNTTTIIICNDSAVEIMVSLIVGGYLYLLIYLGVPEIKGNPSVWHNCSNAFCFIIFYT